MASWHYRFVVFSSPSTLLNGITRLTPAMFLAALYNAEVAGWYGFAQLAIGAPVQLLGMAVVQVYLSQAPKLRAQGGPALKQLFLNTSTKLFWLGLMFLGCIAVPGPWLFAWVFGAAWSESGQIVQLLGVFYLARFVVVPISQTLNMFERQDLVFLWDALNLLALLGSFTIGALWKLNYSHTILIYSLSMTASYLLHFALAFWIVNKHARTPVTQTDDG